MCKVSIIIPVYNVEQYLPKCLDSVINQTIEDYEIIIVNDGATDRSGDIAREYQLRYPDRISIIEKSNGGLGDARNVGIKVARGEFLLFVDSDDWICPSMAQDLYQAAMDYQAEIAICSFANVSMDGSVISISREALPELNPMNLRDYHNLLLVSPSACNKLYHKTLFVDNNIFFPKGLWFEDIYTLTKLYPLAQRTVYMDKPLYNYLRRIGSITQNKNIEKNRDIILAFQSIMEYFREKGLYESYYHELEILTIDHLYVSASVRVIRNNPRSKLLQDLKSYLADQFPQYAHNKYLANMDHNRKVIFGLLEKRRYRSIAAIFAVKDFLSNFHR